MNRPTQNKILFESRPVRARILIETPTLNSTVANDTSPFIAL